MHHAIVERFSHTHARTMDHSVNESRTFKVVLLTTITMGIEILAGHLTGSMALLADGWHMGTHALALGLSYIAYRFARKYEGSDRFSFGTGKIGVLAGYTSALFLCSAALWMIYESIVRMVNPVTIAFSKAIGVTFIGLMVNLVSVLMLNDSSLQHDHQSHDHDRDHNLDHNYRAAYLHVIADTLTSLLALVALLFGRYLGWTFLDPIMGIVGGILICRWGYSLLKNTSSILLDSEMGENARRKIYSAIESDNDSKIADLHIWLIGSNELAGIVSIVTSQNRPAEDYQERINNIFPFYHLTVEVHFCKTLGCECATIK